MSVCFCACSCVLMRAGTHAYVSKCVNMHVGACRPEIGIGSLLQLILHLIFGDRD